MKNILLPTLCAAVLSVVLATPSYAAKPGKEGKKAAHQESKAVLTTYDKNANGVIDGDEVEALRKAFETDVSLKPLDTNGDGKLDDAEIAAIKGHQKGEKKKAK